MKSELKLYVRSKNNIWTDKWISQNMLSAHLNPDSNAASRNIHVINTTIGWITTIIKKDSTVLDLGCGPGLYAEILSKKGYTVTGLDISKRSIRYAKKSAKEKKLPVTYITRDTYYSKKQITELLSANGFKVEEIKENLVERSDFTSNAVIFIKAKKI